MIDWIQNQLNANAFAQGAVLATLLGGVMAYCKKVPTYTYHFLKRKLSCSISINDTSYDLKHFLRWVMAMDTFKSIKQLNVYGNKLNSNDERSNLMVPENGVYLGWIKCRPVWLQISHVKSEQGQWNWKITLSSFAFSKKFMEGLNAEFRKSIPNKRLENVRIYSPVKDSWEGSWSFRYRQKRPKQSIFYNGTLRDDVFEDVAKFKGDKQWYFDRGIPHKRAYLFKSEAGLGKTSLAIAIASELDASLYVVNLSEFKGDTIFGKAWREIERGSVVLIEDIDAQNFNLQREDRGEDKVSLAALLNALDGSDYLADCIIIVTTNKPEVLDEALIREGRIDKKFHFDLFLFETAVEMATHFMGDERLARKFVEDHFGKKEGFYIKPAALQEKLISTKD